ncbi:MAG: DNA polymerase III subunit delta' [Coriobacteriia bacterium]|jgi:DNA polymerase-3 subunit delta'|nr:DNA polymerase III subunit delta' [Coriobacteriia bacterium]
MTKACVWDELVGQRKVADHLAAAVRRGAISHAYLFVGPAGTGKKSAARALACAILCNGDACGACEICRRVKRGAHPDVRTVQPEGAANYVIEQIRDIIHDVNLSPVEASRKIFILDAADTFNEASANAFLKTLEEPPDDVVIILLATTYDGVLPTISSRCQMIRFKRMAPEAAAALLAESTGAGEDETFAALAATGGVLMRAREFLDSPMRRAARDHMLSLLKDLSVFDEHDVLQSAKMLLTAVKAPLDELKTLQAEEARTRAEFLGSKGMKTLEERQKRQLTAREREGVAEVLNVTESWLRDCLVLSQGAPELLVNRDETDAMQAIAAVITPAAATRALGAVKEARKRISYNVSPQLAVEAMLFDIREVLQCPR